MFLLRRAGVLTLLLLLLSVPVASAQSKSLKRVREPMSKGRPLSAWIADLTGRAPETRNAAAYAIAGMGPAAAAAVPALIKALSDEVGAVRFPVTVALAEIGPAAAAAIPALEKVEADDISDDIASSARRAIRRIKGGPPPGPPKD